MTAYNQTEVIMPLNIENELHRFINDKQWVKGIYNKQLAKEYKKISKRKYNIATNSGTSALYIILKALELEEDAEIIIPVNTFIATANAVTLAGYRVKFCDVGLDYNIDPQKLKEIITPKTKAIIVVHLYGRPAHVDRIMEIALQHNLHVVEDACQAHFTYSPNTSIATAYSFFPTKPINTIGEGGMASTSSATIARRMRRMVDVGRQEGQHISKGMNMRLSEFQALVILHNFKTDVYEEALAIRELVASSYHHYLDRENMLTIQPRIFGHSYHQFPIYCHDGTRDRLIKYLAERGIQTSIKYPTLIPMTPAYRMGNYSGKLWYNARGLTDNTLCLPMHHKLSLQDVKYISENVLEFYTQHS